MKQLEPKFDDDSIYDYSGEDENFIDFRGITGAFKRLFSGALIITILYFLLKLLNYLQVTK